MIKALDYSVIDVANMIIRKAREDKINLNLRKLQSLVYFVYGEFLRQQGNKVLFNSLKKFAS